MSQNNKENNTPNQAPRSNFIQEIINNDLKNNKNDGLVHTRFPPEPNGYLHIGHAKSICLNFGLAQKYKGLCNLRFDDTNPCKEEVEYVNSIIRDLHWLGFDFKEKPYYASDYFQKLYDYARELIKKDKAYVCHLNPEEIREYRGTLTQPGKESPYRNRSLEENLDLFESMRKGELKDGECVLRAKIDMKSGNLNMRDPAIYRIRRETHHRTKDKWCIYPMYDFAHCLSDSIEGITHSICTLEFENHRPLYDWILDQLDVDCHPQQIEFARLNLNYTVMSKRKLQDLVEGRQVNGWDDPRLPTLSGLKRRGYTAKAIRNFAERIGVNKMNSIVDIGLLQHFVREDLNRIAPRAMAVLKPLKVIIDNYPQEKVEELEAVNNPEDESAGTRKIPFSSVIYIESDDFQLNPHKKFFRLSPGKEVRLKHAYYITCTKAVTNDAGETIELHCSYDPDSRGGGTKDGRKVKGTLHWVCAQHSHTAEVRLYDHLFSKPVPGSDDQDFKKDLNPDSLKILSNCRLEPCLSQAKPGDTFQFLRQGYFCLDLDSSGEKLIFNRTVSLKDSWAKIQKTQ